MHDVVITGVGIVSAAGEEVDAHLAALAGASPRVDLETFAPFAVHPVVALDYEKQIAKKSDLRQMEAWQKLGCYAAGLALDAAGVKDDAELKSRMHLIVAAGGGERDYAVDGRHPHRAAAGAEPRRLSERTPDGRYCVRRSSWRSCRTSLPATSPSSTG